MNAFYGTLHVKYMDADMTNRPDPAHYKPRLPDELLI